MGFQVIKKGDTQIRTGDKSFAGSCLTTWPCRLTSPLYPILDITKCQAIRHNTDLCRMS